MVRYVESRGWSFPRGPKSLVLRLKRLGNPAGEFWLINDGPRMRITCSRRSKPFACRRDEFGLGVAERSQLQNQRRLVDSVHGVVVMPYIFHHPDNIGLGIESNRYGFEPVGIPSVPF